MHEHGNDAARAKYSVDAATVKRYAGANVVVEHAGNESQQRHGDAVNVAPNAKHDAGHARHVGLPTCAAAATALPDEYSFARATGGASI